MAKSKELSFVQRVIEVPQKLNDLITAGIFAAVLYLVDLIYQASGLDLSEAGALVAGAVSAFVTFALKAALEKFVPESLHPVVNAVLSWLAVILGGAAVVMFLR